MPSKPFDLLVAGEINPDLILTGNVEPAFGQVEQLVESAALVIGSSSVIFACGAARLGLKVAFIGKRWRGCVWPLHARRDAKTRREMLDNVISPAGWGTPALSCGILNSRRSDRAILTHPGLIPALSADDIPDELLRQRSATCTLPPTFCRMPCGQACSACSNAPVLWVSPRPASTPTTTPRTVGGGLSTCSRSSTSFCTERSGSPLLAREQDIDRAAESYRRRSRPWLPN